MGLESSTNDGLRDSVKARIDHIFREYQLDTDARTHFVILDGVLALQSSFGDPIQVEPMPHYKEYITRRAGSTDEEVAYIMRRSNPRAVAAFDALVDEFNADVSRINTEQDTEALQEYMKRCDQVFEDSKRQ